MNGDPQPTPRTRPDRPHPLSGMLRMPCRAMDRGVQYACESYRKRLGLHRITACSLVHVNMYCRALDEPQGELPLGQAGPRSGSNGPGDHLKAQNAPMESFFSSLKTEMVHRTKFRTRREARAALFEYIEIFYNRQRRHSRIGYRTPAQARIDMMAKMAA